MDFKTTHAPTSVDDLVFSNSALASVVRRYAQVETTGDLLLFGPAGSGKSATCRVIADTLLTPEYGTDLKVINVSRCNTKAALCDEIESFQGFGVFNPLGRVIFLLEELDGAEKAAQNALKAVLDNHARRAIFLATTNSLTDIIHPIRDRFKRLEFLHPNASQWAARAQGILFKEGVRIGLEQVQQLLERDAPNGSMRDVMRALETFTQRVQESKRYPAYAEEMQ